MSSNDIKAPQERLVRIQQLQTSLDMLQTAVAAEEITPEAASVHVAPMNRIFLRIYLNHTVGHLAYNGQPIDLIEPSTKRPTKGAVKRKQQLRHQVGQQLELFKTQIQAFEAQLELLEQRKQLERQMEPTVQLERHRWIRMQFAQANAQHDDG